MKPIFNISPAVFCAVFLAAGVMADEKPEDRYAACMDLAEKAPDKAINEALIWQTQQGGVPARHCEAYGLYVAGDYREAAARMELIAEDMRVGKDMPVRMGKRMVADAAMMADMYDQAANAWLLAGEIINAESAIDAALSLTADGSTQELDLLVVRARIGAADEDFQLALNDLERVYKADPQRKNLLVLVAAAARGVGNFIRAGAALEEFMQLYPERADGYLEHGNLMDALGETRAARESWQKVLQLAPDGPEAVAASANLERIALRPTE